MVNINIQEVYVNSVSGYPMKSPHSNNKQKKILYPMRYTVTIMSISYNIHDKEIFMIVSYYILYP